MSERILLRTGEALVKGSEDHLCAEPEIVIGELDGPVGHALANLIGDQVKGHSRVFAILSSDIQVRPATITERPGGRRGRGVQPSSFLAQCRPLGSNPA